MASEKPQIEGKEVFVGTIILSGGVISIVVYSTSLANVLLGISSVMLGTVVIWEGIKGYREKKKTNGNSKKT